VIIIPNESFLDWEKEHHPKKRKNDLEEYKKNSLGLSNKTFKEFMKEWRKKNLKSTDPNGTTKHSKGDKVIGRGVVPPPDGDTNEEE
jgi:hypothetical protein